MVSQSSSFLFSNCFCKLMPLGRLRSLLGALWARFRVLLGLSWRPFRAFLGSFGSNLAASWGQGGGPNGKAIRMAESDPPEFRFEGPRGSKRPPRTPKKAVREPQKTPRRHPNAPLRYAKGCPMHFQKPPKGPSMTPRGPQGTHRGNGCGPPLNLPT